MSSMNSAENLNFKVVIPGDERKPCNFKTVTLDKVVKWINGQNVEQSVKEELIKKARTYPSGSLSSFRKNFSKHLSKAQKIVRDKTPLYTKELGDDDEPESNSHTPVFDGTRIPQEVPESPNEDHFG
jgi:hypothetical protein